MSAHISPGVESPRGAPSDRRHTRALFSVPIIVRHLCQGGVRIAQGISLDVAEGGLGALVLADLLVGETVAIDLCFSQHPLTTVAIVRHTSSVRSGFEFVGLKPEERLQIMNLVGSA